MAYIGHSTNCGIGFFGALTLIFITLKLLGKITWSWWVVLLPVWISAAIVTAIVIIALIIWGIVEVFR